MFFFVTPTEGIYLHDFLLWLDQHPELMNSDRQDGSQDDYLDDGYHHDVTSRYSKLPKKKLSFECDELLRLNHSGYVIKIIFHTTLSAD